MIVDNYFFGTSIGSLIIIVVSLTYTEYHQAS